MHDEMWMRTVYLHQIAQLEATFGFPLSSRCIKLPVFLIDTSAYPTGIEHRAVVRMRNNGVTARSVRINMLLAEALRTQCIVDVGTIGIGALSVIIGV